MLNPSMPVCTRTRSRREARLLEQYRETKNRKTEQERRTQTSVVLPDHDHEHDSSINNYLNLRSSLKQADFQVPILIGEANTEKQESILVNDPLASSSQKDAHEQVPILIGIGGEADAEKQQSVHKNNPHPDSKAEAEDVVLLLEEEGDSCPDNVSMQVSDSDDDDPDPVTPSSEEDNDESEDLDYHCDDADELDSKGSSSSDDETEDDDGKPSPAKRKRKRKTAGVQLVSERIRKGAQKVKELGDSVDVNEEDYSGDEDEDLIRLKIPKASSSKRKRGRSRINKLPQLLTVLADSVLNSEESDSSESAEGVKEEKENTEENSLPLKFTFGVGQKISVEKKEYDKELDPLWEEMQLALTSSEIGSTNPSLVENEDVDIPKVEHDRESICGQGNHQLVLDEEIGIICKFCSFVQLEIKYIAPPFMTPSSSCVNFERGEYSSNSNNLDFSVFDDLIHQDDTPCFADSKGTVWEIIPEQLKNKLHPHQREGFEFIWKNIEGGIYRDKWKNSCNSNACGGGCIISHAPGTGKTLLTIVFLKAYLEEFPRCRPVIVAPSTMLLTWEAEFRKWEVDIPFHNLNSQGFSGQEKTKGVGLYRRFEQGIQCQDRPLARRLVKLLSWKSDGGILGISYRLFERLVGTGNKGKGKRKCTAVDKRVSEILLDLPGLFVFDEGHTPRNDGSLMWKALSRIKTGRRLILSGTPFQNNFNELFNTLYLVRPEFAEKVQLIHGGKVKKKPGHKGKGNGNEAKWTWTCLTGSIGKDFDVNEAEKLKEVRDIIRPFVHVHKGDILQTSLKGLRHSVVVLQPSDLQKKILECVKATKNALNLDYYVSLISVHPSLLLQLSDDKDIKGCLSSIVSPDELERIRLNPDKGVKTKFLMGLLKYSEALEEKVIVFSQYLEPLYLMMEQLKEAKRWKEGKEILFMHGRCVAKHRQRSINAFNDPGSNARVMLASTKACSEGINLVGGSRVVLLDVAWNPSVERQAISRAYRLGQDKVVYTYHLISSGTMEGMKCYRKASKGRVSKLLFSSSDKGDDHHKEDSDIVEDKILEEMFQIENFKSMFDKILINEPKHSDLIEADEDV